jgi:RimJ/RimL family protein N-acetyltransferase
MQCVVRRYKLEDEAALKSILTTNLEAHMPFYTPAVREAEREYCRESCAPDGDLSNVEKVYFARGGFFWVLARAEDDAAVGGVGLEVLSGEGEKTGELRRMHLAEEARGKGYGHDLVAALFRHAVAAGLSKVVLSTVSILTRSRAFYTSLGFRETRVAPLFDLPDSPGEVFYETRLIRGEWKRETMGSGPTLSLHHAIELRDAKYGKGLFAREAIESGVLVWRHVPSEWHVPPRHYRFAELPLLTEEERTFALRYGYQVGDDAWEAPAKAEHLMQDYSNFMNHACEPNVWFVGDALVSCRRIEVGEEITYDYCTSQSLVDPLGTTPCGCGHASCRGLLRAGDWKDLREKYSFHFVPYLLAKEGAVVVTPE